MDEVKHCPVSGGEEKPQDPMGQFVSAQVNEPQCPDKAAMPCALMLKHPAGMEGPSQLWITCGS